MVIYQDGRNHDLKLGNSVVRNINTTFSEQIFDISVAEWKTEIQPDGVLNDHGWKSVSGIGDVLHPATLLRHQKQVSLLM